MRKLIAAEHISLDGVMQAPGGPEEDPSGDFRFGGWSAPYDDDAIGQAVQDLHAQPFELLLGRRTYDIWATYWPRVQAGHAIADLFNRVPKHGTSSLDTVARGGGVDRMRPYTKAQDTALLVLRLVVAAVFLYAGSAKWPFWAAPPEGMSVLLLNVKHRGLSNMRLKLDGATFSELIFYL
jgi:hypothetical protein